MGAIITATGHINGHSITVTCKKEKGRIMALFNGGENPGRYAIFRTALEQRHPVGGTYYPGVETMLNAVEVLNNWFFDDHPKLTVQGEIEEIPYEPGVIY